MASLRMSHYCNYRDSGRAHSASAKGDHYKQSITTAIYVSLAGEIKSSSFFVILIWNVEERMWKDSKPTSYLHVDYS